LVKTHARRERTADDVDFQEEQDMTPIDLLRRRSGGGTVFHSPGNLNYCAIVPNDRSFSRFTHAEMVVRGLKSMQQKTTEYPGFAKCEIKVNERHDIVMKRSDSSNDGWLKVSGSAYKLTRGRALHHGTLLVSSPYLARISALLNGLGKDLITTKGVGSVRSPVGNLFPAAAMRQNERAALVDNVQQFILQEWSQLYPDGDHADIMTLTDRDCEEAVNPAISKGVAELQSLTWKFGQTPRFTFESSRPEEDAPQRLLMEVNRGVMEKLSLEVDGELGELDLTGPRLQDTGMINEISSWRDLLLQLSSHHGTTGFDDLMKRVLDDASILASLDECFPWWTE
jgi:lipoate---protein ligase